MPLEINNLCQSYGEKEVLRGFGYRFPEAGVVALQGPSGCGKTTLLRVIAGLEKPRVGTVSLPEGGLSLLFQENRLLESLTARGNVAAVLRGRDRRERAEGWLARMGLAEAADSYPSQLSGGMQRRVALARALAFGGKVLLLDEPFQGLDRATRERVMGEVLSPERRGTALILLVTHDREEAAAADLRLTLRGLPLEVAEERWNGV